MYICLHESLLVAIEYNIKIQTILGLSPTLVQDIFQGPAFMRCR